jgi:uncharacterized protein YaaN involved in tellurite resistance
MTDNEVNSLKTDIALIQKDIKQIENVFQKVDSAVGQMADIHKSLAVQENILEHNEKRLDTLEDKLIKHTEESVEFQKELNVKIEDMKVTAQQERERRHKEVMSSIENLSVSVTDKIQKQDARITALENWRWYILGASAAVIFIITKFPWDRFFG